MDEVESERQSAGAPSKLDTCEVTGFESRLREECEEVSEIDCKPIQVKKIRTEIREKCEVMLNKTCSVVFNPEPKKECKPITSKRCSIDFKIVPKHKYSEECSVDVEHICEDYVHVPVPDYGHHEYHHKPPPPPPPPPPPSDAYGLPLAAPLIEPVSQPQPVLQGAPITLPLHSSPRMHQFPDLDTSDINSLAVKLFSRSKRDARSQEFNSNSNMRELLTAAVFEEMQKKTTEDGSNLDSVPSGNPPSNLDSLPSGNPAPSLDSSLLKMSSTIAADKNIKSDSNPVLGSILSDKDLELLETEIISEIQRRKEAALVKEKEKDSQIGGDVVPEDGLMSPSVLIGVPLPVHVDPPAPIVTVEELPSEPGCRTIATKKCYKTPIVINNKVPYESCKEVPDVECITVLQDVPDLKCVPEPYTECNDIAIDIPFLEPAEECEEVVFEDCVEIEEKVPIELCTRKRVNEESFFLERGKTFRKEGEKRRKKIGQRGKQEDKDKKEEQAEEL